MTRVTLLAILCAGLLVSGCGDDSRGEDESDCSWDEICTFMTTDCDLVDDESHSVCISEWDAILTDCNDRDDFDACTCDCIADNEDNYETGCGSAWDCITNCEIQVCGFDGPNWP